MKVLLSWLREFVDVRESAEEIARVMSLRGFAVEGIDELPADARRAKADAVIDFEVTGNRPDCMSVLGMAREIATAFERPLTLGSLMAGPPAAAPASHAVGASGTGSAAGGLGLTITLEHPDLCPYYAGGLLDVAVGPSPDWIQARLTAGGVRPISNIVDVTNYVLLELGQPTHAFDAAKIDGQEIRVRTARDGERLTTLDGQDRALTTDMLVIADAVRPVAIAGIMGGGDSEVSAHTRSIILESAYFNPASVRRTSRKLGVKTEASTRFERGTDRMLPGTALRRAFALYEQIGAGQPRATVIAGSASEVALRVLSLRRERIASLLGTAVPDPDVVRILTSLGFDPAAAGDGWTVTVPARRIDVAREVDLIEEVARHYGYDRIPGTFPALGQAPAPPDPRIARARQLRSIMTGAGFFEANTFGFIAESAATPFAGHAGPVSVANPLSENFGVLRPSCVPGLVDAVVHNRHRQQRDVRLFEIGSRFLHEDGERRVIAAAWSGSVGADHWAGGMRPVDFFDIKGVAERICAGIGLNVRIDPCETPWLVRGHAAALIDGDRTIGCAGQLLPSVAEQHGLAPADVVYVAEIDLDAADARAAGESPRIQPLPRFPSVSRDLSIVVAETLPAEEIRRTVRETAPRTLTRVREFDRYQGKGVPQGRVSLSLRLTFRSPDRTLTDAEVQHAMDDIITALQTKHEAVQR